MPERDSFQLTREELSERVGLLVLTGEADRFRVDQVCDSIDQVRGDDREVVVDLSGVTYMDSSMLAALVAASEHSRRRGKPLVIVCENTRLRRSLELKGLENVLQLADDHDQALALLSRDVSA